ncbi:MAG: hypothetical protein NW201_02810 [Gemmatimonadales bacterium]|nr:hypothetical protein [Gemmatimonadales bacterium]
MTMRWAALAGSTLLGACASATGQGGAPRGVPTLMGSAPMQETVLCLSAALEKRGWKVLRKDTVDGLVEADKTIETPNPGGDMRLYRTADRLTFEAVRAQSMPLAIKVFVARELRTYAGPRTELDPGREATLALAREVGAGCGEVQ